MDIIAEGSEAILFYQERFYRHNLVRFNYTSYDIRRCQDVVNSTSSHHNVMVLANGATVNDHPFRYARVIGIFHANVMYVGKTVVEYRPQRVDFLWVRWYQNAKVARNGWKDLRLDMITFQSAADPTAFGFVDPSDIIRGCHIIPSFQQGKVHQDGKGISHFAQDKSDWAFYYVNR